MQIEQTKQEICKVFKVNNLSITMEANKKIVNFLDVTLDLTNRSFKPFMKPNNKILYVHRQSNHPQALLKNIPENINKRLPCISSTQQVFNETIPPYQKALDESGYNFKLAYCSLRNETKPTRVTVVCETKRKGSEVSSSRKLRPPNFIPRKLTPRKLRPLDKTTDILNAVLHEYLFMVMIMTNPKCQITQQSRVGN